MKKLFLLFSIVLFLTLTACSTSNSYIFSGGSENWKVSIEVSEVGNGEENKINIEYIGSDFPPNTLEYSYDTGTNAYSGTVDYQRGGIEWERIVCRDCIIMSNEREFDVEIKWDGKKEAFILRNNN